MPVYDFVHPITDEVREAYVKSPLPTGGVAWFDGVPWTRKVSAPQRTHTAWSDSAETNSPFYSHLTGKMVKNKKQEDQIAKQRGLHRLNEWDAQRMERIESDRKAEEDRLLATPLPDLNEIINADRGTHD